MQPEESRGGFSETPSLNAPLFEVPNTSQMRPSDPLAEYTPVQRKEIEQKLELLSSLAYHIGKDFTLPVLPNFPGQGWHWNFALNEVRADSKDILEKPFDYCRFVIAHEGSHVRITRISSEAASLWGEQGFAFLTNCIEDPRVNNFVVHAYPFLKEKMDLTYSLSFDAERQGVLQKISRRLGFEPLSIQAGHEYIRAWLQERQTGHLKLSDTLHPKVLHVLEKTVDAASFAWRRYPSKAEADQGEPVVHRYSEASQKFIVRDIWPLFKTLVTDDIQRTTLGRAAQNEDGKIDPRLERQLNQSELDEIQKALQDAQERTEGKARGEIDPQKLSKELQEKMEQFYQSLPDEERKQLHEAAKKSLEDAFAQENAHLEGKIERDRKQRPPSEPMAENTLPRHMQSDVDRFRSKIDTILNRDLDSYTAQARNDSSVIARLVQSLEIELNRRHEEEQESGFSTGSTMDLRKRISEIANQTPATDSKAWRRIVTPSSWSYAFTFLVDLSPSMEGEKIKQTFRACVVISEALRRAHIPFEIVGFNNKFHTFKSFAEPVGRDARERLGGMCKSTGGSTDMGFGVLEASERLAQTEAKDQILVVLTDGNPQPSSAHSGAQFKMSNVLPVVTKERGQKLLAVGLAVPEQDLADTFPDCVRIAEKKPEQLFRVFARLVEKVVQQ